MSDAVTALILDVFQANGRLIEAGDRLVGDLGLTSARWQVLGAAAPRPAPVAHIARAMGLSRQNVQRIANDLAARGIVVFAPNPHHQRAHLVVLTERGRALFEAAGRRQAPWAAGLADGLTPEAIATASTVLRTLCARLETAAGTPGSDTDLART